VAPKQDKRPKTRTDQVRAAVDQAFTATAGQAQVTRERAQEIADELATAASRVRDALDELRPPTGDELRSLTTRLDALEKKVAALEATPAKRTPARKPAARKPAARKKPAAKKPAPKKR
jgi:sec-independent protein translocase protein TatB